MFGSVSAKIRYFVKLLIWNDLFFNFVGCIDVWIYETDYD